MIGACEMEAPGCVSDSQPSKRSGCGREIVGQLEETATKKKRYSILKSTGAQRKTKEKGKRLT